MKRILLPILLLLITESLTAQEEQEKVARRTRIAKQSATTSGDRGLFTVPSVETLNQNQFSFGYGYDNIDRTPKDIDVNSLPIYFSYGVFNRLTVTASFDTQRQVTARNPIQPGFYPAYPFIAQTPITQASPFSKGYGDTVLGAKYRIHRRGDNVGGIAVRGFVKIGTADPLKGLGTGQTDGGLDLIFSSLLWADIKLESNLGYTMTSKAKDPFVRDLKDEMRSGFGVAWPSSRPLQGLVEYSTTTFVGCCSRDNLAATSLQNAGDLAAGLRYVSLDSGLTLSAGYRINRTFDLGFTNNRNHHGWTFNLTFTKPVAVQDLNNRYPVIALESAAEQIAPGGTAAITATAFDSDNDTMVYSWATTGGQIIGAGDKVTFNAAGLSPGTYTIRATVTDGRGGIATSEIDIVIRQ